LNTDDATVYPASAEDPPAARSAAGSTAPAISDPDVALLERLAAARERVELEVAKQVVGQKEIIELLLIAILAGGHALLVGVPGLAKTLLVSSLARSLRLKFSRVQFTPDLMPSDITGTEIIEENVSTGRRGFRFVRGPIFANVVLADEINRTPPKTQAALLQAMQELEVTVGGVTYPLDRPFFVLATQNPIELEGTYPLPEAQLDRFMLEARITKRRWRAARRATSWKRSSPCCRGRSCWSSKGWSAESRCRPAWFGWPSNCAGPADRKPRRPRTSSGAG